MVRVVAGSDLAFRPALTAGLCYIVAVLACFWPTLMGMVDIWSRSDTFAHGFLVGPISAWLVWRQREGLAGIAARPVPWVLPLMLPLGFAWVLAELAEVRVVAQLAMVAILPVGLWAILGHALIQRLAFPLGFLFLSVPIGEGLIPPMMEFTAWATVWLVEASGVPVYREGLLFTLPTGVWSVVEACSGVRYLIASFTLGLLYAYLTYRSLARRVLFALAALLVPVIANALRAYFIVMLGHLTNGKLATGVDHLLYGWVFFGLVMLLLFWLGGIWREDTEHPRVASPTESGDAPAPLSRLFITCCGAILMAAMWPALAHMRQATLSPVVAEAPPAPPALASWEVGGAQPWRWQPVREANVLRTQAVYRFGGEPVVLYLDRLDPGLEGAELVAMPSRLLGEGESSRLLRQSAQAAPVGVTAGRINQFSVADGHDRLRVWYWYQIGSRATGGAVNAKILEAWEKLRGSGVTQARIIVVTREDSLAAGAVDTATERLARFLGHAGPVIENTVAGEAASGASRE
ncbi:exosortase A [Parahaliea mediterranea]|uniref:Exosortase A n=1 Tax=Parahaliea mediterranea TaxID=651086 RepID=A0A939IMW1_9GAMM|nr:exosortase A [Parahaliea mediterranea]MBN7797448.1 exosortase A [Parahaliea mediterranea]